VSLYRAGAVAALTRSFFVPLTRRALSVASVANLMTVSPLALDDDCGAIKARWRARNRRPYENRFRALALKILERRGLVGRGVRIQDWRRLQNLRLGIWRCCGYV